MKTYIDIVKCYDVVIRDAEGNELMSQMVYSNNQIDAMKTAKEMQKEVESNPEIYDIYYYDEEE